MESGTDRRTWKVRRDEFGQFLELLLAAPTCC